MRVSRRGLSLAELLVASALALLVALVVCGVFWTSLQRARWTEQSSERQRRVLTALERLVADAATSAPEGVRRLSDGSLVIVPIVPSVADNQRRWRLAAIGYGVNQGLWRMEQINPTTDFGTTPSFPTIPSAAAVGWQRSVFAGIVSLDTALRGDALTLDAGVELLRSDGSSVISHLLRTVTFVL